MGSEIIPALGTQPPLLESGFVSLPPGCGLDEWLAVRLTSDGTVANALTLNQLSAGNGQLPDGLIDISRIPMIGFSAAVTVGSLTNLNIIPHFTDNVNFTNPLSAMVVTAGIAALSDLIFRFTANAGLIWSIPNPGCKYMKIYTSSTGTITGSTLGLFVGGGWSGAKT